MSSQALDNIANILLVSGIFLFILTIILALRFNIIGLLRAEFGKKDNAPVSEAEMIPSKSVSGSISEIGIEENRVFEEEIIDKQDIIDEFRSADDDIGNSDTVVVSSDREKPDPGGTVLVSRKNNTNTANIEFCITEDIIVIHGDPHIIK